MSAKEFVSSGEGNDPTSVVVDAMGGDQAPREPVAGAVEAAVRFTDTEIILVGPEQQLRDELKKHPRCPDNLRIVNASETIGMHESPISALREKRDSSISVGVALMAEGKAGALLSAGNTGAVVAASSLGPGLLTGVQRPGIAVPIVALDHPLVVIDVGANIHCKPMHLLQYGLMATVFARDVLDLNDPRVGLLNVGEEERKGTDLQKDAFELLQGAPINFVGNVEAKDIFFDGCDIVVCEGFAGNVLLKTSETLIMKLLSYLRVEIGKKLRRRLGFALCKDVFKAVRQTGDYAEYGGAPLLGINGVTIICHGRSDAKAIENGIREARSFINGKVNDSIVEIITAGMPEKQEADSPESAEAESGH